MKAKDFFDRDHKFYDEKEIKGIIRTSKNYSSEENTDSAEALLIFKTSKQRTWLIATDKRLYCVLDDYRKPQPSVMWSKKRDNIFSQGNMSLNIQTRDYKQNTGLVDIGTDHKDWLFSKSLFINNKISDSIIDLIKKKMS